MDHGLDVIGPILEILEIEVSKILYTPGNIWNLSFIISHLLAEFGHPLKLFFSPGGSAPRTPRWLRRPPCPARTHAKQVFNISRIPGNRTTEISNISSIVEN